jgi:hypothetical protein
MYNCKKNGTTSKMYVGIIQEISTTAKKIGTTAKQNVQLQKKKHNCETHLLQLYIFWQYLTTNSTFHFSFPFLLISTLPCHPATAVNKVATSRAAAGHCLSRATSFFYFCYFPLPSIWSHHHPREVKCACACTFRCACTCTFHTNNL